MSIGEQLLGGLIDSETGVTDFFKLGLSEKLFKGEAEKEAFQVVQQHVVKYGVLPSRETVLEAGVKLPKIVPEPAMFYVDKMKDRFLHMGLKSAVIDASKNLNEDKPLIALETLISSVLELQRVKFGSKVIDYAQEGLGVVTNEYKNKILLGDDYGLQLGWPTLDAMTGGLIGGDVLSIVGRPAAGKTYKMLYAAQNAWKHGKVPMVVSMEMKPLPIIQRLAAMQTHKSITQLKQAMLSTVSLNDLKFNLTENTKQQPFWIIDGALAATVEDILILARQLNPDVIFIDGAYLLRHGNKFLGRWERVTENAERIKGDLAEGLNVPVAISYQFNRKATEKKAGAPGVENIAYTDAIGQLSSVVLGMMQEDSVETLLWRRIEILKGRNGEAGDYTINWSFDTGPNFMDFTEVFLQGAGAVEDLNFLA